MTINFSGGNKTKKLKNNNNVNKKRDIEVPETEDDSHVAIITKILGDGRYLCKIVNEDGILLTEYLANLSKGTKNKYGRGIIVTCESYVLIAKRNFQKNKVDIIFVYRDSELSYLINNNYISIEKKNNAIDDIEFCDFIDNKISTEQETNIVL